MHLLTTFRKYNFLTMSASIVPNGGVPTNDGVEDAPAYTFQHSL